MNSKEIFEQKLNLITEKVPNYMSINPYLDRAALGHVKRLLTEAGYHKGHFICILDSVAINLILAAQKAYKKKYYVVGDDKKGVNYGSKRHFKAG